MANINRIISLSQITKAAGVPTVTLQHSLILSANIGAVFGPELSRAYASASALDGDWAANTPARVYGDQLFGQGVVALVPDSTRVGKLTVGPSLIYVFNLPAAQAASTKYGLRVNGNLVTYTTTGSPANDDVVTNLATAITALSIAGLTVTTPGTAGSKTLTLTWDATHWGYISLKDGLGTNYGPEGLDLLEVAATTVDPGTSMATQLANIRLTTDDFFFVLNPYPGLAISQVIATWCASNDKLLIQADPTSAVIQHVVSGATDLAAVWQAASMANAALIYHPDTVEAADAAWVGGSSPAVPGTEDWNGRVLGGVVADNLTDTQMNNSCGNLISGIAGKSCSVYVPFGNFNMVQGGNVASGLPIDLVKFQYALSISLKNAEAAVIANAQPLKVPGNTAGIQTLYGAALEVFQGFTGPSKALASFTLGLPANATIVSRVVTGLPYIAKYNGSVRALVQTGLITQ